MSEKRLNKNHCFTNAIISSIVFGKLFLLNKKFFLKYFNSFVFSIIFIILLLSVIFPITPHFCAVLYNVFIFSFYSVVSFLLFGLIFKFFEYFYPNLSNIDLRFLKNSYVIVIAYTIIFDYFYYNSYVSINEPYPYIAYIYFDFAKFINLLLYLIIICGKIMMYFIILFISNVVLNKIIPQFPRFSANVLFGLNIFVFILSNLISTHKIDFSNINEDAIKKFLLVFATNLLVILVFTATKISKRLYKYFNKALIKNHENMIVSNIALRDNKILHDLVYHSRYIRIVLISIVFLIFFKLIIISFFQY